MSEFDEIRERYLESAPEKGRDIIEESRTFHEFASDTYALGMDARNEIEQRYAEDPEGTAARFVGYEVTERARAAGMSDEEAMDSLAAGPVRGEAALEVALRAFNMVDKLSVGLTDLKEEGEDETMPDAQRFPQRYSENLDRDYFEYIKVALEESETVDPDAIGQHFHRNILILNDEWNSYRNGEKPPNISKENYEFLRSKGIGNP